MAKPGPEKKNYHGFDDIIMKVRSCLNKKSEASLFYVKGKGFVVRNKVLERFQGLIDEGKAELVCTYNKDVNYLDVADDCVWTIEHMVRG